MTLEHIRIERDDRGLAQAIVARPEIGNASTPEMPAEIRDAFLALGDVPYKPH